MVACIVIGSIILGLLLLLLCPVKVKATMQEELTLQLCYGPVKLTLLPAKEKPEKPEQDKAEKPKKKEKTEAEAEEKPNFFKRLQQKHGLSGLLELAVGLAKLATTTLRSLFSHVVVYKLYLQIRIGSDNAADTAISHGKVCAILDACAAAFLPVIPQKKRKDIQWSILPDFVSEETQVQALAVAGIRPLFVFGAVFAAAFRFLRLYLAANRRADQRKAEQTRQATTTKESGV